MRAALDAYEEAVYCCRGIQNSNLCPRASLGADSDTRDVPTCGRRALRRAPAPRVVRSAHTTGLSIESCRPERTRYAAAHLSHRHRARSPIGQSSPRRSNLAW